MTRLILIRHGETEYNVQAKYCGFSNPPINNKGIWQSERLAGLLEDASIDKIFSSDLLRAYETAKIIFKDRPVEKTKKFREMNFGIFEGLGYEQIMKLYPELYTNWIADPLKVKVPEGEDLENFSKRVEEKLFSILFRHKDKTIAVVTHGGPIKVILCTCRTHKFGFKKFWEIRQDNGALNIIDFLENAVPRVVKINDISHLSMEEGIGL